jgi:Rieske Fe-S protein
MKPIHDPHWKTDFSVDWEETSFITRREFTRFLALGSGAMAAGNVFMAARSSVPTAPRAAKKLGLITTKVLDQNNVFSFEYPEPGMHAILVKHEDGSLNAFSQRCPHLGCSVYFSEESRTLECPCHEGFFDAKTGGVLAGPPQRGLARIELEVTDGTIFAVGGGEA